MARSATGRGVFARRSFRPTETVGRVRGKVIRDPSYTSDYCMDLGDEASLEPAPPFRYLNHSCEPNCALVQVEVFDEADPQAPPQIQIWVETVAPVVRGEQLTIDYGWPAHSAVPCACASPHCRGWIVAEEELDSIAAESQRAPEAPPSSGAPG